MLHTQHWRRRKYGSKHAQTNERGTFCKGTSAFAGPAGFSTLPRMQQRAPRLASDSAALVDVGVHARVVAGGADHVLRGRVEDDDIRVRAGRQHALARVDVERVRGRRAGQAHKVGPCDQPCEVTKALLPEESSKQVLQTWILGQPSQVPASPMRR